MADETTRSGEGGEAREAIAAFEQILEFQPDDIATLEALAQSYELIGEPARARTYVLRLGRVLLDQADRAGAARLAERLRSFPPADAEAAALREELHNLTLTPAASAEGGAAPETGSTRRTAHFEEELALAWSLHEADLLKQEEYAAVVQDLTESSGDASSTVSVLHALRKRSFARMDEVLDHISRHSGRPLIHLAFFDAVHDLAAQLPLEFMTQRGAAVFGFVGREAMVAVLNPLNERLRQEVETALDRPCHLFLTSPADFDAWIARARDALSRGG